MQLALSGEKLKALETALAQIEKQCGKGSIMRLGENMDMEVTGVSTGSLSLDLALGIGGVPKGRIIEIFGPESSGKTTVALHIISEVQKSGGEAAFIDAEHALYVLKVIVGPHPVFKAEHLVGAAVISDIAKDAPIALSTRFMS